MATDWLKVRDILWERSGGLCEVSGVPLDFERFDAHHRRNKGMGGTRRADVDWPSNLLALDSQVHNGGPLSVHGRRTWSQPRGYLLPKDTMWAGFVPVLLRGTRWVLLPDHGVTYLDVEDIPALLRPPVPALTV